jgi:predicted ArsR family transcriptional regulator
MVLDLLRRHPGPVGVGEIAREAGLHENTVREHFEGLLAARLVRRERAPAVGRGRPAWLYAARPPQQAAIVRDYTALASVLAGIVARTATDPEREAAAAGADWGRALASDLPPEPDADSARRRVVQLFTELGFAPETDDDAHTVHLTRCPLLDVAREHPGVVCSIHRGVASSALDALGAADDAAVVRVTPFAGPGYCLLHLGASPTQP